MARRRSHLEILTLAMLPALVWATGAWALPEVSGGLGVEVDAYAFSRTVLALGLKQDDVTRSLSTPYVELRFRTPLLSARLAHLSATGRVSGAYYQATNRGEETGGENDPELTRYDVRLSLFGVRSFPLGLYMSRSELPSLRYEVNNRAASDLQSPTLTVVRRYDTVAEQRGGVWKWALPRRVNLSFAAYQNRDTINRQYDFGEDRDIFVDFQTIRPDPVANVHPVVVQNELPDDTVLVFINHVLVDTLAAGELTILSLDSGSHATEFVPLRLNPFRATVVVRGDMQWKIVHNPPPGSKDVARATDVARSTFAMGGDGPFQEEAFLVYNKVREDVQRLDSELLSFNNLATYARSRNTRFDFLTTGTKNTTDIEEVSSQTSSSLMHQTTFRYRRRRGANVQLLHSFGKTSTKTDVTDVASDTNSLSGSATAPTGFGSHEAGVRGSATFLADNIGYRSRQYSGELNNRLDFRTAGIRWLPRHTLKYTTGTRENPDGSTKEIESAGTLGGEVLDFGPIGRVKLKGGLNWRRRETGTSTGTKATYLVELGLMSRSVSGAKIGFNTSHELQRFGRPIPVDGSDLEVSVRVMEDQIRHMYRVDLQSAVSSFTAGVNAVLLTTNDTRIRRITASLSARVPVFNAPLRSSLMDEQRDLVGLPTQKLFEIQTRVSFSIRRVRLVVSHVYSRDRQITEEYRYQQILADLTRDFDIF